MFSICNNSVTRFGNGEYYKNAVKSPFIFSCSLCSLLVDGLEYLEAGKGSGRENRFLSIVRVRHYVLASHGEAKP
jgi:hypothetical protein